MWMERQEDNINRQRGLQRQSVVAQHTIEQRHIEALCIQGRHSTAITMISPLPAGPSNQRIGSCNNNNDNNNNYANDSDNDKMKWHEMNFTIFGGLFSSHSPPHSFIPSSTNNTTNNNNNTNNNTLTRIWK
jgi:hypothetical protein